MFRIALVAGNIEEMEGMEQGQPRSYKPFPCRDFVVSTSANNTKRDSMPPDSTGSTFHTVYTENQNLPHNTSNVLVQNCAFEYIKRRRFLRLNFDNFQDFTTSSRLYDQLLCGGVVLDPGYPEGFDPRVLLHTVYLTKPDQA